MLPARRRLPGMLTLRVVLCVVPWPQVTSPVLWENTMQTLFSKGLTKSYEIGPNKVISGIAKRINKEHEITNISA